MLCHQKRETILFQWNTTCPTWTPTGPQCWSSPASVLQPRDTGLLRLGSGGSHGSNDWARLKFLTLKSPATSVDPALFSSGLWVPILHWIYLLILRDSAGTLNSASPNWSITHPSKYLQSLSGILAENLTCILLPYFLLFSLSTLLIHGC